jgi:hypothetical protein
VTFETEGTLPDRRVPFFSAAQYFALRLKLVKQSFSAIKILSPTRFQSA